MGYEQTPIPEASKVEALLALYGLGMCYCAVGLVVSVARDQPEGQAVCGVMLLVTGLAFWIVLNVSYVVVSNRGVRLPLGSRVRRDWLPWSDIEVFERQEAAQRDATTSRIVARTILEETVTVCALTYQPILFDTSSRHDRAVTRVLRELERERRARAARADPQTKKHIDPNTG